MADFLFWLSGCDFDTILIKMHEAPKVSATRSRPPTKDGQPKVKATNKSIVSHITCAPWDLAFQLQLVNS